MDKVWTQAEMNAPGISAKTRAGMEKNNAAVARAKAQNETQFANFLKKPGLTDSQIASEMRRLNVSPAQVSKLTGVPVSQVQSRVAATSPAAKAPTPKAPTPKAPTPKAPTPKAPVARAPTPSRPAPAPTTSSFRPSPNRPATTLTPTPMTSSFRPSPNRPTAPVQTGVTFRPPAPRPPAPVSSGVTFRPPAPRAPAPVSSGVTFRPASNRPATPSRFDQMMANLPTPVMPVIDRGSFNTNLNNYLADTLAQAGVGNPAAAAGTAQADLNAFDNVGPQDIFQSSPAGDFGGGTAQDDLSALDQADARADAIAAAQDNLADTADARADAADAATNEFADIVGGVGPSARDDLNNLTGTPGGVSDEAVRAYLQNNPNLTDGQIREAMDAFGVAPDQVARATGLPTAEVQQRYDDAGTARGDLNALPGQAQYTGPTATGPGQVNANIPAVVVPPTATPPAVPPVVQPPGIPPAVPPVVQPPVVQPPVVQPPVVPPVVQPPVVPPVVQPPVVPPVVQPPVVQPPVVPPVAPPEAYTGEIPIALARGPAAFSQSTMRPRPDMGAMPLPGGIPSPAAVQLRSGPNAFEDEVLRRGIASIDAPALPEMTSQTIARPSGSMDPHSLGGYKQLSNTFGMTRDRAGNLSAVAQAPSVDAIREGQLTSQMAVPVMPRFFKEGGEAVASPSLLEYIQQQGEEAPIDTDPMGTAQQLLSNVVRVDRRPAPTRQSVKRVSRGAGRDAAATDPMGMKIPSLTESKQMELDTSSSPAESQYKGTAREQMEELARTYQLKINAAKNKARGLAADTFGAPTLEQPTLAKRSLTKRSFATGGEVKGAAPDQAPKVTGINRILDFVAQRLPADAFPTAGRVLLESVQGKRDPITESSFSKDELEVLRQLTRGDKGSVAYSDYQNLVNQFRAQGKDADATSSLFSLGSPIGNVRNTLGRFNYTRDPRGNVVIEDSYDFNPPDANMTQEARTGDYGTFGPYNLIRDYAGEKIPPGSGRNVRINLGLVERSQNISPEKPKNKLRR